MKNLLFLTIGGSLGTILRYFMTNFVNKFSTTFVSLELGTLFVNILGCFLIGFFVSMVHLNDDLKIMLISGFCGAFTTFSTLVLEVDRSHYIVAIIHIVLSVVLGILFFRLGGFLWRIYQ